MFHPLSTLFRRESFGWEEADVKYFIQHYLQEKIKTEALYCEKVNRGVAVVRVATAFAQQEATILEFDLARDLYQKTKYHLRQLIVYVA